MSMSVKDTHSDFNNLVSRFLSGELSPEEELQLREIVRREPEKSGLLDEYRKIWDSVGSVADRESYDLDAEWEIMREKLPETGTGLQTPARTVLFYTYRIAAALVVGLIFAFAWIYATRLAGTEQLVAENEPMDVVLGDGTRVTVNRNSKIRYRKNFSESERKIYLAGEAWFEVARDTSRPFVIDAGTTLVEVLGTRFNVNAYKENLTVEITVESGVVALTAKQDDQEQIVLQAGNSGTFDKESKQLNLIQHSNPNNISWKTRELYFDHSSLQEVVEVINTVYSTNLVIMNRELAACPITVTFRDQSLEAVLNVLEMTLDLDITHTGGQISLDGAGCVE